MLTGAREPLSNASVDAALAPLADHARLLVAVSGGPDSTALLAMAADWSKRRGGAPVILAATVDHRLRVESAAEAQAVAALCRTLRVEHATLAWDGPKPRTRLQERAREARYAQLIAHARAIGAGAILTAHHADDQAETVLFRLLRGSGVAGLRGMRALSERDGVVLARPLLGLHKEELVDYCRTHGLAFAEDASNADPRHARTRLRTILAREGLDAEALLRLARRAGEADEALRLQTAELQARLGDGPALDAGLLFAAPTAVAQRALAARLAAAGGGDPSRTPLDAVEALEAALRDAHAYGCPHAANVAGAEARLTTKGRLTVTKERPRGRPVE